MPKQLKLSDSTLVDCGACDRRNSSVSVSWNTTGRVLASSSHNTAKLWPTEFIPTSSSTYPSVIRETTTLQHNAPVDRVRFHPKNPSILCTNVEDKTIQLWDLRENHSNNNNHTRSSTSSSSFAKIPLKSSKGNCAASVEWENVNSDNHLVVTEKDNTVRVLDVRKLRGTSSSATEVKLFHFENVLSETHFSPSGTHLVSAARRITDGMGLIHVYEWKTDEEKPCEHTFVGHSGPIYSLRFSPDGKRLATGGNDALVGLWDVKSMVCEKTISRRTKFIRSVAFSFDSNILACCSEEAGIDLADPISGEEIGILNLEKRNDRSRGAAVGFGCDEIEFCPKAPHVIACARGEVNQNTPQVSIARVNLENI